MSGDKKVTGLQTLATPAGVDRLLIIDNPLVNAVSKQISLDTFFANIPSNTSIGGTLTSEANASFNGAKAEFSANVIVSGETTVNKLTTTSNGIIIEDRFTPASSNVSVIETGKIFYDENYLYIKVSNNTIKRVSLSTF